MSERLTISFPENDKDLKEYVEYKAEKGEFSNESHVIRVAIKRMKDNEDEEPLL